MRHLFIINPVAGKLSADKKRERLEMAIGSLPKEYRDKCHFEVYYTQAPLDACAKIRAEADKGGELRVYACGGDGTLNECVNGAAGRANVAVTHYPCGTGNDFIKTFGEESARFFDVGELISGELRPIDLIECNGRYSVNICSLGIDARVGADVHKYSRLPLIGGASGYIVSAAAHYIRGLNTEMSVRANGHTYGPMLNLICACNGRYYGGGFNPVPQARPDDGVMDCLIISGVSRLSFLGAISGYAKGQFERFPQYITHVQTDELEITAGRTDVINIDGEVEYGQNVKIRLVPKGVNFIFPRDMAFFA